MEQWNTSINLRTTPARNNEGGKIQFIGGSWGISLIFERILSIRFCA